MTLFEMAAQLQQSNELDFDLSGQLTAAEAALNYILAGNAYFTLRSKKTGTRFTFRAGKPKKAQKNSEDFWYLSLLNGPDNEANYTYAANMKRDALGLHVWHTSKTKVTAEAPSMVAFNWVMDSLMKNHLPTTLEIWHEGRCGRCGKKLTVPESVERGIGPECASKMGLAA